MNNIDTKPTILITDDEPLSVEMLCNLLKDDYEIVMAHNGHEALELAEEHGPDLILLDILMPDLDGYEVYRLLRELPVTREIPVIFITALGEHECEQQGLEMGAGDYVIKPFNPALVRLRVRNHLELKRQRDQLQCLNSELADEVARRRAIQAEHEVVIKELREAMAQVKTLSGLLPICASCRKVRDDQGYWNQLEDYLAKHTDICFTHGLCQGCMERLYPEFHPTAKPG